MSSRNPICAAQNTVYEHPSRTPAVARQHESNLDNGSSHGHKKLGEAVQVPNAAARSQTVGVSTVTSRPFLVNPLPSSQLAPGSQFSGSVSSFFAKACESADQDLS